MRIAGCLNCRGECTPLRCVAPDEEGATMPVESSPKEGTGGDETGKRVAGPILSRPGGGRHSTSNQLSLRLLALLERFGDRQGELDKS